MVHDVQKLSLSVFPHADPVGLCFTSETVPANDSICMPVLVGNFDSLTLVQHPLLHHGIHRVIRLVLMWVRSIPLWEASQPVLIKN